MSNNTSFQDSIFWVETEKIQPNPYQPRKEFNQAALQDLADSIRQYGILNPLTVTRHESAKEDGGLAVHYELIAGERRLRASKLAGVTQVPVVIRTGEQSAKEKLELAIIENLQREDLNPVDRARAFFRLADEFGLTHAEVGKRMGKSREYVSNTIRLLQLPQDIMDALAAEKISEGHTRPLMMLRDHPEQQHTVFQEILHKKLSVRDAEQIARKVAKDKVRKPDKRDPKLQEFETKFSEKLGTRVSIQERAVGGRLVIDFFSDDDLETIFDMIKASGGSGQRMMERFIQEKQEQQAENEKKDLPPFPTPKPISEGHKTPTPPSQSAKPEVQNQTEHTTESVSQNRPKFKPFQPSSSPAIERQPDIPKKEPQRDSETTSSADAPISGKVPSSEYSPKSSPDSNSVQPVIPQAEQSTVNKDAGYSAPMFKRFDPTKKQEPAPLPTKPASSAVPSITLPPKPPTRPSAGTPPKPAMSGQAPLSSPKKNDSTYQPDSIRSNTPKQESAFQRVQKDPHQIQDPEIADALKQLSQTTRQLDETKTPLGGTHPSTMPQPHAPTPPLAPSRPTETSEKSEGSSDQFMFDYSKE